MGHVVASAGGLLFLLLSLIRLFTVVSASEHPTSELLWQARQCIDSGRYLDFFSDPVSESLPCVSTCPTYSVAAYQTCVGPEHRGQAQEIAITLHTVCDYTCFYDSGVELSSRLWMGLARVLHVPLAEMSASILILHTTNRQWLTLEHFFMWREGIDNLAMPMPSVGKYSTGAGAFDLFMAVRIHTSRLFYNSQPLSSMVSGNAASLTSLVDHRLETVIFQATRRQVDRVQSAANTVPRFKFEDRGWNENPWSSSSSSRRRTTAAPSTGSQGGGTSSTCSRGCYSMMVGDGVCQAACYTSACHFDMGDCSTSSHTDDDDDGAGSGVVTARATTSRSSTSPACPCSPEQLGNAMCDGVCNVAACNYDGGDCTTSSGRRRATTTMSMPRTCGCASYFLGDGICDSWCNNAECDFDHGDCDIPDAHGGSGAGRATASTTRSTQTTRTSHTSTTSSRSSTSTSASSTSSTHHSEYTALRGGGGAVSGNENTHSGDHSAIDVIVEEHEVDWRVLAYNDSGRWYMDERRRAAQDTTTGNPLKSAVFIIAFFAVLGAMTVIGVCLVARGISPASRRRKRFPAFYLDGEEDKDDSWMSPTRPTSSSAANPKGASVPQKAAPWSVGKDGKEHLRDFMHWRPKRSYSRAASAQATRAKEQMGPKSGWKAQAQAPPFKGMPADARSASKISVNSEDSESTAVGSHSTPSSSFSAQNSWRASDTAFSWTFSGYKERVREPKVHPEPSASAPTEDSQGAWFFNNSSRFRSSSPLRMAANSSWKEPERPPPPPPMPSVPPVAPTGPAPRGTAGAPAFTTARAMGKSGAGRMTATKSEPTYGSQARQQSSAEEQGNHHHTHHQYHHSNPTSSSPPMGMKMGATFSSSSAKPSRSAEHQQPHVQQKHSQQKNNQPQQSKRLNEEEGSRPKASPPPPTPKAENRSSAGKPNTEAAWRTLFGLRGGNGGTDAGVRPSRSHRQSRKARSAAEAPNSAATPTQQQPQQPKPKPDVPKTGSSGRSPSHPPPQSQKEQQQTRAHSVPASSTKTSKWWAGSTARKPPDPETQSKSLISDMEKQLAAAKNEPLEARKHIFKELQRQLHPDKNIDQPEAAKLAFQKLMEQRAAFLAP